MTDDIVARLRESDGGYFVRKMFTEAADEIERLRVQALGTQRRIQDQDAIMAELWERIYSFTAEIELLRSTVTDCRIEIESTRAERDEARREVCQKHDHGYFMDEDYAEIRGWDCFKEDGDVG